VRRLVGGRTCRKGSLQATDIGDPDYFHKVVDCQWACPAHTPVPEYIRLIAAGRYTAAYMVNWESNVFPGILGRTCDRPCEPACRRGRVEEAQALKPEPVAICRLKRVAADLKDDISAQLPRLVAARNGKRIACIGGGPASLTVAADNQSKVYGAANPTLTASYAGFVETCHADSGAIVVVRIGLRAIGGSNGPGPPILPPIGIPPFRSILPTPSPGFRAWLPSIASALTKSPSTGCPRHWLPLIYKS